MDDLGYIIFIAFCFAPGIFLCYIVIKRINKSLFSSSTDSSYELPDSCSDLDESILVMVTGEEPYKIELLKQSLDMGYELEDDGAYVTRSIELELPYFCETKQEFEMFFDPEKPVVRGSILGMISLILFYDDAEKAHTHPAKRRYWQEKLRKMANNGSYEVRGALCSKWGELAFSKDEVALFKQQYETDLRQRAQSGNHVAQLALGEFLSVYNWRERMEWLSMAAQGGLSDAWYQLGQVYTSAINFDQNNQLRKTPLPEDKVKFLKDKAAECYLQGAEANNGVMAAWCQCKVGDYYKDGSSVLLKDADLAMYWYQMAMNNGEEQAIDKLEFIQKNLMSSDEGKRRQAIANASSGSDVVQECMRFFAVMLSLNKNAKHAYDDIFLGTIYCNTQSYENHFHLEMSSRVPQWSWYLKNEEEWGDLFCSSVLERAIKDAKEDEPCLGMIASFTDLGIEYAIDYEKGEEWVIFSTDVYFSPDQKKNYTMELEQMLNKKYPGAYAKGQYGMIRIEPSR